ISVQQWCGIFLVFLGIVVLYMPWKENHRVRNFVRRFAEEPGTKYMCIAALMWALVTVFDRVALRYTTVPINGMIHFSFASLFLWGWIFWHGGFLRENLPAKNH